MRMFSCGAQVRNRTVISSLPKMRNDHYSTRAMIQFSLIIGKSCFDLATAALSTLATETPTHSAMIQFPKSFILLSGCVLSKFVSVRGHSASIILFRENASTEIILQDHGRDRRC